MKKLLFALFVLAALISTTLLVFPREARKPFQAQDSKLPAAGNHYLLGQQHYFISYIS